MRGTNEPIDNGSPTSPDAQSGVSKPPVTNLPTGRLKEGRIATTDDKPRGDSKQDYDMTSSKVDVQPCEHLYGLLCVHCGSRPPVKNQTVVGEATADQKEKQ